MQNPFNLDWLPGGVSGPTLAHFRAVDRGVIATAHELFEARHYPSIVAMISEALAADPGCVALLVLRARAHLGLFRELEAQADLRDVIRLDPRCGVAYRLLGELAARRNDDESAAIFFREALRLDPGDHEASEWLQIVGNQARPAAAALKLPAPAAAAGRFPRFAKGTHSDDGLPAEHTAVVPPLARAPEPLVTHDRVRTLAGHPCAGAMGRRTTPELPGFGDYLVETGVLTRERLRAAQAYQRSMKVQLSSAIVTLGLASPQRVEGAAVAHKSRLDRR